MLKGVAKRGAPELSVPAFEPIFEHGQSVVNFDLSKHPAHCLLNEVGAVRDQGFGQRERPLGLAPPGAVLGCDH